MTWIVEFEIDNSTQLELKGKFESEKDTKEEAEEELDLFFFENEGWDLVTYDRSIHLGDHELIVEKVYLKELK